MDPTQNTSELRYGDTVFSTRRIAIWLLSAVLLTIGSLAAYRMAARRPLPPARPFVAVLALHRVLPDVEEEYIISTRKLAHLLDELNRLGYEPIRLQELEAALRGEGRLPLRPAMLIFDDAYYDSYRYALPLLVEYGWPAVFSIPTGLVSDDPDSRISWGRGPSPESMTWAEIEELVRQGMEVASHSVTHKNLTRLSDDELRKELLESRDSISHLYPPGASTLVYPGGRQNHAVREAARQAGYGLGFLSGGGGIFLDEDVDLMSLPRIHVPGYRPVARHELRRLAKP